MCRKGDRCPSSLGRKKREAYLKKKAEALGVTPEAALQRHLDQYDEATARSMAGKRGNLTAAEKEALSLEKRLKRRKKPLDPKKALEKGIKLPDPKALKSAHKKVDAVLQEVKATRGPMEKTLGVTVSSSKKGKKGAPATRRDPDELAMEAEEGVAAFQKTYASASKGSSEARQKAVLQEAARLKATSTEEELALLEKEEKRQLKEQGSTTREFLKASQDSSYSQEEREEYQEYHRHAVEEQEARKAHLEAVKAARAASASKSSAGGKKAAPATSSASSAPLSMKGLQERYGEQAKGKGSVASAADEVHRSLKRMKKNGHHEVELQKLEARAQELEGSDREAAKVLRGGIQDVKAWQESKKR